MKAHVQKLIAMAVFGLALVANNLPAWAGMKSTPEVTISNNDSGSYAFGTIVGARYSGDSQQYIGCRFANSYGPYVFCSAQDKTGKTLFCTSTDANLLAAAKVITHSSSIGFNISVGSTSCSQLEVGNDSKNLK